MNGVYDGLAFGFFVVGCALALVAGIALLRFPDLLARMHAGTKPQTLGLFCVLTGVALRIRTVEVFFALLLVAIFQFLTIPVAAHMVGRAGYRTGKVDHSALVVDELGRDLEQAGSATGELPDD